MYDQGTQILQSYPFGGVRIPFSQYWPSGGNKEWAPQYKSEKVGNLSEQKELKRLQLVHLECS